MSADYVKEDPISKASVKKLEAVYTGELVKVDAAVKERGVTMLVGSSGTMQNIAAMIAAERLVAGSNGTAGTGVAVMLNEFEYTRQEFTAFYRKFLKMDHKTTACGARSGRQTGGFHCGRTRAGAHRTDPV